MVISYKGISSTTQETPKKKKWTNIHNDNKGRHGGKRWRELKVATWNIKRKAEDTEKF